MKLLSFNIYTGQLNKINLNHKLVINTLNPYSFLMSLEDNLFRDALNKSDILLPDGIGIVFSLKYLYGSRIKKISGYDLFLYLMSTGNSLNKRIYFLGSTEKTLKKIKLKAAQEYPNLIIDYYSPPFKNDFNAEDNNNMIDKINAFNPDILFVGMTAPKQEKWVYQNEIKIKVNIIASIGAVFDFYSGNVKRSPDIFIKLGLEWLPRLIQEPRRLWRRTFITIPKYIFYIVKNRKSIINS